MLSDYFFFMNNENYSSFHFTLTLLCWSEEVKKEIGLGGIFKLLVGIVRGMVDDKFVQLALETANWHWREDDAVLANLLLGGDDAVLPNWLWRGDDDVLPNWVWGKEDGTLFLLRSGICHLNVYLLDLYLSLSSDIGAHDFLACEFLDILFLSENHVPWDMFRHSFLVF